MHIFCEKKNVQLPYSSLGWKATTSSLRVMQRRHSFFFNAYLVSYPINTSWASCPCFSVAINSRMSACNAHNQELQRKVSQLEKRNMWETSKWDSALHFQTILPLRSPPLWLVLTFLPIHILPATHSSFLQSFADLYALSVVIILSFFLSFLLMAGHLWNNCEGCRLWSWTHQTSRPRLGHVCWYVSSLICHTNKQTTVQPLTMNCHSTNSASCWTS